jgi:hypothetical protein
MIGGAVIVLVLGGLIYSFIYTEQQTARCEARGGTMIWSRVGGNVCLKSELTIKLD